MLLHAKAEVCKRWKGLKIFYQAQQPDTSKPKVLTQYYTQQIFKRHRFHSMFNRKFRKSNLIPLDQL